MRMRCANCKVIAEVRMSRLTNKGEKFYCSEDCCEDDC